MFVFRVPKTPKMFAWKRSFDAPALVWGFAIF